jgi:hypothetical protein
VDIKETFAQGGAGLSTPDTDGVSLTLILRDIATDLASLNGLGASIAAADPTAISASALASPLIATADADATYGQPEADLLNELKADLNIAATLANQLRVTTIENRVLALELKGEVQGIVISSPDPTAISASAVADPLITTADADATYGTPERDLANEIKADLNILATLVNQIRVTAGETRTLLIELKTDVNAAAPSGTLLTAAV